MIPVFEETAAEEIYPDMNVKSIRGNLQTRLEKLDNGDYAGLVLAAAGLKRLGLEKRISRYFDTEEMVPAAGQGILAVQGRKGLDYEYLEGYDDLQAHQAAADGACLCEIFKRRLYFSCGSLWRNQRWSVETYRPLLRGRNRTLPEKDIKPEILQMQKSWELLLQKNCRSAAKWNTKSPACRKTTKKNREKSGWWELALEMWDFLQ